MQKRKLIGFESIVIQAIAGANQPTKNKKPPKTLKNAIETLKQEISITKGENASL